MLNDFSLGQPPAGTEFIGDIFDLSKNSKLEITGGSVDVSFEYGNPDLLGLPTADAARFELVRFANGRYQPFLSTFNDTSDFVLSGVYDPPSPGSGLDPFGEFAIVMSIPEPGALMLLAVGLAGVACAARRREVSNRRGQNPCRVPT